jgi:hypothetical protein
MIFSRPMAYESKHRQKLIAREVNAAALGEAVLAFLKWSETTIIFEGKDHPDHIPQPGRFPPCHGPNHRQDLPISCSHG